MSEVIIKSPNFFIDKAAEKEEIANTPTQPLPAVKIPLATRLLGVFKNLLLEREDHFMPKEAREEEIDSVEMQEPRILGNAPVQPHVRKISVIKPTGSKKLQEYTVLEYR